MKKFMAVYTGSPALQNYATIFPGDGVEIMECLPLPTR